MGSCLISLAPPFPSRLRETNVSDFQRLSLAKDILVKLVVNILPVTTLGLNLTS